MVRRIVLGAAALAAAVTLGSSASAQFTVGNLAVARVGDGTTALSGAGFQINILEYNTLGALTGWSVALPTAAGAAITNSGTAVSSGMLHLSTDGNYLVYAGYRADVGTASVTSAAGIPRVPVRIDGAGSIDATTVLNSAVAAGGTYATNNFRSATTDNGSRFWLAGTSSGTPATNGNRYATLGATSSVRLASTGPTNSRNAEIYGGLLFGNNQTTLFTYGAPPTPAVDDTATATAVIAPANADIYGFALFDRDAGVGAPGLNGLDTIYLAHDNATASLEKWEWDGVSAWVARGAININSNFFNVGGTQITTEAGFFGLTAAVNPANGAVDIFMTTSGASNNWLASYADTSGFGGSIGGNITGIAQSGANFRFQGLDFSPAFSAVPEPTSLALLGLAAGGIGLQACWRRKPRSRKA